MNQERKTAYFALLDIEKNGAYSNLAVNRAVRVNQPQDPAFVRRLVYGTLENQILLDYQLNALVKSGLRRVRPQARVLLRMGACQISCMDSVPAYAAISETISLAKRVCRGQDRFISGVLHAYEKQYMQIPLPDRNRDPAAWLSVRYSCSRDIVELWLAQFGAERTKSLLQASNLTPPLTIRVNRLRGTFEELATRLRAEHCELLPVPVGNEKDADLLKDIAGEARGTGVLSSQAFRNGYFSVQDASSMLAIRALDPGPGDRVLDLCAAPGGKSLCSAEWMGNQGEVLSCDIFDHKLELIRKNAETLGITILQTWKNDASVLRSEWVESADRVIVDAPCSGLGVLRRKPEIKLRPVESEIRSLTELQTKILDTAAACVRPGGRLMYSTCTISKEENENQSRRFLQNHPEYERMEERQLYPDTDRTDGFYYCIFQRSQ